MIHYFCTACNNLADPLYYTNGEHLCRAHWIEFYG